MAASVVAVANTALISLGAELINDIHENSEVANAVLACWEGSRRAVLSESVWSFSTKRVELARNVSNPVFGYQYEYTLPSDCLRVVQVYLNDDYKVEDGKILTNDPQCFLKYVYDQPDTTKWTSAFADLMSARLRMDLAYAITRSNTQIQTSVALYRDKLKEIKRIDSSQDMFDDFGQFVSPVLSVRY